MKTRSVLLTILSLALITQMMMSVNSYPDLGGGGRNCYGCHNEPASTGYNSSLASENMIVDGESTEDFWGGEKNRMYIPIANPDSDDGHDFQFVRTTFAQNSTHLFIMIRIHDDDADIEGADNFANQKADKFAFIWNINATSASISWADGMSSTLADDEAVDLWTWQPAAADSAADTVDDTSLYFDGIIADGSYSPQKRNDHNDLTAAAKYNRAEGHTEGVFAHDYYVEITRPLVTDDTEDVQFDHTGFYEFAIAIWNGSSGADHYVSFGHMLWVENGPVVYTTTQTVDIPNTVDVTNTIDFTDTKTDTPYLIIPMFAALVGTTMLIYRRRK